LLQEVDMFRSVVGLIVSAATLPLVLMLVSAAKFVLGVPGFRMDLANAAWAALLTIPAVLIIGGPAHFIAARKRIRELKWYLLGGGVVGLVVASTFFLMFPLGFRVLLVYSLGVLVGIVSAGVLWLIAVYGNQPGVERPVGSASQ
jgi:hypothetical protein